MLQEIGSDFWNYPISAEVGKFEIAGLARTADYKFYISGRSAIRAFLKLNHGGEKRALLPEFTCETVVIPFEKEGWQISYYPVKKNLKLDSGAVLKKISEAKPNVFYIQSYFGFNTLEDTQRIISYCRQNGILVIEDLTQCVFSNFEKTEADFYVASLRKFFAVPEGGLLLSSKAPITVQGRPPVVEMIELADRAFRLKDAYIHHEFAVSKKEFMDAFCELKSRFAKYDDVYQINNATERMLGRIDFDYIRKARRRNYAELYGNLKKGELFVPVLGELRDEETPLYFPIYILDAEQRERIQATLSEKKIYCPIVWPKYKRIPVSGAGRYIYDHILCIPCDQRYGPQEMQYICEVLNCVT